MINKKELRLFYVIGISNKSKKREEQRKKLENIIRYFMSKRIVILYVLIIDYNQIKYAINKLLKYSKNGILC